MTRAYLSGAYMMAEIGDHFGVHSNRLTGPLKPMVSLEATPKRSPTRLPKEAVRSVTLETRDNILRRR